jgi:hypothetical protein
MYDGWQACAVRVPECVRCNYAWAGKPACLDCFPTLQTAETPLSVVTSLHFLRVALSSGKRLR